MPHDEFGCTTDERVFQPGSAVCCRHNQICPPIFGTIANLLPGVPDLDGGFDFHAVPVRIFHQVTHLPLRGPLNLLQYKWEVVTRVLVIPAAVLEMD